MKILIYLPLVLLIFFTFSIFYVSDNSFDQDLGRHLKLGEIIVNTHQVPTTNLFSYTNPDFNFINHHFLFEIFIYFWSKALNLQSLLIFKIVIILSSVTLLLSTVKKSNYPLLLPLGYIFFHVLRERTDLRPELFSFLFTCLTLFILERYTDQKKTKLLYLLPPIAFIWINTHIYFILGLVIQIIYLTDIYLKKDFKKIKLLTSILILSILSSIFNPNMFNGLLYPFTIFNNYGYSVAENQSIFLLENIGFSDNNFLFVKISSLIILLSIIISFLRNSISFKGTLLCLTGLVLALVNIRSFPYLVFLSFPAVLQNFNVNKFNKKVMFLIIISGLLLLIESFSYLNGSYFKNNNISNEPILIFSENIKDAMDFVLSNNLPQPIYNNFDIGSYIIYRGFPEYKVFVDGRPEAYPVSFFQNTYIPSQSDYNTFKNLEKEWSFQTIIFSITDQTPWGKNFLKSVVKDKTWSIVYLDHFIIVLVKNTQFNVQHFQLIDLNILTPDIYQYDTFLSYLRIGYFLSNCGFELTAKRFIDKGLILKESY